MKPTAPMNNNSKSANALLIWLFCLITLVQAADFVVIGDNNSGIEGMNATGANATTDSLSSTSSESASPSSSLSSPPEPQAGALSTFASDNNNDVDTATACLHDRIHVLPQGHQQVFRVGVLAIRGEEAAYNEFNATFSDYLTATAGQRFDPPLQFEMIPLNFIQLFSDTEAGMVDLIYVNPSAFSCIESEYTARSLCSQTSRRKIHGNIYDLKKFGGVIMTRSDNEEVNFIQDLKGKIVAAASISGLGSGQMQFLEMQKAGMSYINDPKQLVFTSNQGKVVNGVLNGLFDVGFVRTDQIERSKDANGTLLDPNLFKVIDPVPGLNIDGEPFPFEASTPLYPEWNLAALHHVSDNVNEAVQAAMLALADHASVAVEQQTCMDTHNSTTICHWNNLPKKRCDTTPEISEIALVAKENGKYAAWEATLSYMQLRSMQEVTGFIQMDPADNIWKCTKSKTIYDSITCPSGYYKATEEEVDGACEAEGLPCNDGYQCICSPCVAIRECVDAVDIRGNCVSYAIFLPAILVPLFLICAVVVVYYVEYRRKQADAVWSVQPEELEFENPSKVIGRGTFGYVLLAEYRGTKVAVKRVLPSHDSRAVRKTTFFGTTILPLRKKKFTDRTDEYRDSVSESGDIESNSAVNLGLKSMNPQQLAENLDDSLKRRIDNPGLRSMLTSMTSSIGSSRRKPTHAQLQRDFVREMRHLAKLRHPCITTVMGAVVSPNCEPMLVMEYMTQGSLYDVLRDEAINLDVDEQVMPILQDIAQGIRFLHAANPIVVHGDLKAKNVLIDTNFRAKVTDFGLSAKKQDRASGTPYWMAPELLRGETNNNAQSDIYAFGILIYEVFSRQNPYDGEYHLDVLRDVCDPKINKRPPTPAKCSFKMADLMKDCLAANPRKRPSAELVDVALRVEGSVKERTSKLEQLNRELEEANKKIAQASSMQLEHFACMSHEIRTPLNCIVGIASLMDGSDLNPSQQESIGMIAASSSLLQSIVNDVLDYSKLQSGNAEVDIKRTDIQKVVADLVNSMRASVIARKRNLTIETRFHPLAPRYAETDGRRLLQILFNLVSNAVKFSKNDGVVEVKCTVCDRSKPFPEDTQRDEDCERRPLVSFGRKVLRFTVKDHGKGIEEKNFDSIFQPFTQTNSGINNIDGGTGLGLAITEKLVRALGGDISVDSCLSQWTEFTVDFPLEDSPVSIPDVSAQFKSADLFLVGDSEQASEILSFFHVESTQLPNMEALADEVKARAKSRGQEKRALVCLVKSELFDDGISRRLATTSGLKVIVLGPKDSVPDGVKHVPALGEIVPSAFMEDLAESVKESLEFRRSQAQLFCSEPLEAPSNQPCDLTKLRILCAEDNLVNQKILIRMLKRVGVADIEMVENGQLAVEKEAERAFDIILMDMQMPVMDGIDATKLIVKREGGHRIPLIVFVTAHVSSSFEAQCLECGATAYLPKPYTLPVLKETLLEVASKL